MITDFNGQPRILIKRSFLGCLLFLGGISLGLHALEFQSGLEQTALIELYSSEGCSSCPPADRWIGSLRKSKALWSEFVPVVFHVTYWDRLGWRDIYAKKEFTARQYRMADHWGTDTVYTPSFVLNGKEWRGWYREKSVSLPNRELVGTLMVTLTKDNKGRVVFKPTQSGNNNWFVQIATLGMAIESKIGRGENRNRVLKHNFLTLHHEQLKLKSANNGYSAEFSLPSDSLSQTPKKALAVWVTGSNELIPVQAVGGFLNGTGSEGDSFD